LPDPSPPIEHGRSVRHNLRSERRGGMPDFSGFRHDDFGTLDGSSWRGRDALGGVLARALRPAIGPGCQSWGVRRRVELHIARKSVYNFDDARAVAKLFVYTHDDLVFGFYVEATGKREDDERFPHWRNFRDRIQDRSALRDALEGAVAKHDLTLTDYYRSCDAPIGRFRSVRGTVQAAPRGTDNWAGSSLPEFAGAIAGVSGAEWIDLHIFSRMDKTVAIGMGAEVVGRILSVLDDLVPVYLQTIA